MDIPYYLDPNVKQNVIGTFDIFGNVPIIEQTPTDIWGSLSESATSVGNYVWDSVEGAWVHTKEAVGSLGQTITNAGKEAVGLLGDVADWGISRILLIAGVLILFVWVLGKSGIFKMSVSKSV